MFDIGFSELLVIGVVALIVIGPQKLPRVARTVGHLLGKAQRYVADVKAEVNRSIELEELKKMKTASIAPTARTSRWRSSMRCEMKVSWSLTLLFAAVQAVSRASRLPRPC